MSSLLKLSRLLSSFGMLQVSRTTDMIFWLVTRQSFLFGKERLRDEPIPYVGLVIIYLTTKLMNLFFYSFCVIFSCNVRDRITLHHVDVRK